MTFINQKQKIGILIGLMAGAIASVIVVMNPYPHILMGWLSTFFLAGSLLVLLYLAWQKLSPAEVSRSALFAGLAVRLVLAAFLFAALPVWGHDEPTANNGYLYLDAYRRDSDAWALAQSDKSLGTAFQETFSTDQYGGLLALSAGIYRYLSPLAQRPLLVVLVGASLCVLGIPFLWDAARKRWGKDVACWAVWIYALYPESLFLSAAQMREPALIGLSALTFWSVITWKENRLSRSITSILSLIFSTAFSFRAGILLAGAFALLFFFEHIYQTQTTWQRRISIFIIALAIIGAGFLGWGLLTDYASYDMYLLEAASGRVSYEIENIGGVFKVPFIIAHGLAQPVLPASIAYPGIPLARAIAIIRSIGWYCLIPVLLFSIFSFGKAEPKQNRNSIILLAIVAFTWIVLSSARAGGDQWDNPRYRAIFMVWQSVLAAWSIMEYQKHKSPWLHRIVFIEAIFVLFFLQWYLSRYYDVFGRLFFWQMVLAIIVIAFLVLVGGYLTDKLKKPHL